MVKLHLELEGEVGEVVRVLRRIGGGGTTQAARFGMGRVLAPTEERTSAVGTVPELGTTAASAALVPGRWTEELAADFTAGLEVVAGRVLWHVWRGGAKAGIHRNTLWPEDGPDAGGVALVADKDGPRAGEVPAGAGHGVVAAGGGQQPVAELFHQRRLCRGGVRSVGREDAGLAAQRLAAPLKNACHRAPGRTNRASVVEHAD